VSKGGFYLFSSLQGIIEEVDIRKIKSSSFFHRGKEEQQAALSELADSIKEKGLLQPITVRTKHGYYEVVIGNRRLAACKLLGLRKVICNVVELDDKEAFETSLVENMQRRDLSPLDEARAYREYVTRYGRGSSSSLARRLGRSVPYIDKRIRLLDLPADIISMISCTDISVSSAEELLSIKDTQEQCKIAKVARDRQLSLREVRELVLDSERRGRRDHNFSPQR
jgi:ParB family chromosome partitioning protein